MQDHALYSAVSVRYGDGMRYRFPAEWEPHRATWIAWPYVESDFPHKVETVQWVYVEIVRHLAESEQVEILVNDDALEKRAREMLCLSGLDALVEKRVRFHKLPYDRTWLRDCAPTFVVDTVRSERSFIQWKFNAWAKYGNYLADAEVPTYIGKVTGVSAVSAVRPDSGEKLTLEGGAIETDGFGTLLTTEECLLSTVQERNAGLSREGYEQTFRDYLGIEKVIWLGKGLEGDDTHGHIDDLARFYAPGKVLLVYEEDTSDPNHLTSRDNLERLRRARDARGAPIEVSLLPTPSPTYYEGCRLPSSYANFYIGNTVVLVPTFNDPNDSKALSILRAAFPGRKVVGIHCLDLVVGYGTLHCLSQQEPIG